MSVSFSHDRSFCSAWIQIMLFQTMFNPQLSNWGEAVGHYMTIEQGSSRNILTSLTSPGQIQHRHWQWVLDIDTDLRYHPTWRRIPLSTNNVFEVFSLNSLLCTWDFQVIEFLFLLFFHLKTNITFIRWDKNNSYGAWQS